MTDSPDPTKEQERTNENIFNSDIGDDWGEAFQAENFMFSPDEEASSEFFLEDDSFDPESSASPDELSSIDGASLFGDHKLAKGIPGLDKLLDLPAFLLALPLKVKIPAIGLALVLALFFLLHGSPDGPDQQVTTQESVSIDQGNAQGVGQEKPAEEEQPLAKVESPPEKVRKRWKLPSFLLSALDEENKVPALLSIDVTVVLQLAKDDRIPEEKELLVRETIFQFFNNQPFSELQRFNLSRGEMTRSLEAWIEKQLPDIPLAAIVFDRYLIL
jgi:hypothetical protein